MITTNFLFKKFIHGVKHYPFTSSLLIFNLGTYFFSKIAGDKTAKNLLLTNTTERYFKTDIPIFNTNDLIRNFTHFSSSINEENLIVNSGVLLLVSRNLEIMFGSSSMSRVLIFNYIFQTASEIKKVYFSDFIPPKEHNPSYSLAISLAFLGYALPININAPVRIGLFVCTLYAIFNCSDVYISNAFLSSLLTMFFLRNKYNLL